MFPKEIFEQIVLENKVKRDIPSQGGSKSGHRCSAPNTNSHSKKKKTHQKVQEKAEEEAQGGFDIFSNQIGSLDAIFSSISISKRNYILPDDSDESGEDDREEMLDQPVDYTKEDGFNSDKENSALGVGVLKRVVYTPYKNDVARELLSTASDSTMSGGLSGRSPLEDITPHVKKTKNVLPELKPKALICMFTPHKSNSHRKPDPKNAFSSKSLR